MLNVLGRRAALRATAPDCSPPLPGIIPVTDPAVDDADADADPMDTELETETERLKKSTLLLLLLLLLLLFLLLLLLLLLPPWLFGRTAWDFAVCMCVCVYVMCVYMFFRFNIRQDGESVICHIQRKQ